MYRDAPGSYAGSYTGRGYNEYEEISPGFNQQLTQAVASNTAAVLSPAAFAANLPGYAFLTGNLGLGLIGLTAAFLIVRRVL